MDHEEDNAQSSHHHHPQILHCTKFSLWKEDGRGTNRHTHTHTMQQYFFNGDVRQKDLKNHVGDNAEGRQWEGGRRSNEIQYRRGVHHWYYNTIMATSSRTWETLKPLFPIHRDRSNREELDAASCCSYHRRWWLGEEESAIILLHRWGSLIKLGGKKTARIYQTNDDEPPRRRSPPPPLHPRHSSFISFPWDDRSPEKRNKTK